MYRIPFSENKNRSDDENQNNNEVLPYIDKVRCVFPDGFPETFHGTKVVEYWR